MVTHQWINPYRPSLRNQTLPLPPHRYPTRSPPHSHPRHSPPSHPHSQRPNRNGSNKKSSVNERRWMISRAGSCFGCDNRRGKSSSRRLGGRRPRRREDRAGLHVDHMFFKSTSIIMMTWVREFDRAGCQTYCESLGAPVISLMWS